MGTAELKRSWLLVFGALTVATALSALTVGALGPALQTPVHSLLDLRLSAAATPAPSLERAFSLAAHNLPVTSWPLLLQAAGAQRSRRSEMVANTLLAATLGVNALLVGAAFGAYGPRLAWFVPQLPLEWAALAGGAAVWVAREGPVTSRGRAEAAATIAVLVLAAAALETYAVPHHASSQLQGGLNPAASDLQTSDRL